MRPIHAFCTLLVAAASLHAAPSFAGDEDDEDCEPLTGGGHEGGHDATGGGGTGKIDETRPAKPNGTVDIHVFSGTVHVTGWGQNFVHVTGRSDHDCKADLTPSGDRTVVNVECSDGPPDAELEIQVPQTGTVEVRTMSAEIAVHGVTGVVRAHTVAADIHVDAPNVAEVEARTTSGSIEVHANSAATRAHSVSGNVSVTGAHGRAAIHSVSGECQLEGGDFSEVSIQSVSGNVAFRGAITAQGNVDVQSHSGDIELRVPATTNADVELRSFSGDLAVDVSGGRKEGARMLQMKVGNGGSKIRAHSFSGDVIVTAQPKK